MPKALHKKLAREARQKGLTGDAFNRYVYGTLEKIERKSKSKRVKRSKRS